MGKGESDLDLAFMEKHGRGLKVFDVPLELAHSANAYHSDFSKFRDPSHANF